MRILSALLACVLSTGVSAQIIAPDTVCVGATVNFTTTKTAVTYSWDFSPVSVDQPISAMTTFYSGGLSTPAWTCLNNDGGNYYCFITEYTTQHIKRLSFGTDIHSVPTVTDLGTFGMTAGDLECIDVVKDTATGLWYGIAVNYSQMVVLSFGSSLSGTPTSTLTDYTYPSMQWSHQVTIKRYLGNWIAFVANRNSNITRFDFGSSLTSVPVVTNIPNVGSVVNPTNFSLYEQAGNWYMLVTSLISGGLSRYDFGTDLLNNAPTGTLIAGPGGFISLPRYISLLNDCQGHLIGYMGNETGNILKLDFAGSITNVPVVTLAGYAGTGTINVCAPVSYNDTLAFMFVDYTGSLVMYHPMYFAPVSFINYYNPVQPYTYTTPGTYNVSLMLDQGYPSGPFVSCKSIVVVSAVLTTATYDTTVCVGSPVTLTADATGSYVWNTGASSSSIVVTAPGTYWVNITTGSCGGRTDTFHVTYGSTLAVSLGNDTAFCIGSSITLSPSPVAPPGSTFTWSTGALSPSIIVNTSGTYWVHVIDGGCSGSDTINVLVSPVPPVDLGPDTILCAGIPLTLQSSDTYSSPAYLWSTGSTAASINPTASSTYWLKVTVAGCAGSDTVNVTFINDSFTLHNIDTAICRGKSVQVRLTGSASATYFWLPTAGVAANTTQSPLITPDTSAMYRVKIQVPGCHDFADSFYIDVQPNPTVYMGGNRSVCDFDTLHLHAYITPNWYTHYIYNWTPATYLDDSAMSDVVFRAGDSTKIVLTVTTPAGCKGIDSALIIVYPGNFANLDTTFNLCPHDSVRLLPTGGVSYRWHPGMYLSDSTTAEPWVHAVTSLTYTVIATSQYGCLDTMTASVVIRPAGVIFLGDSVTIYPGESYQITPQTNCVNFSWFPPAGLDNPTTSNPVATPQISTKYIVHASTEYGCKAEDSISIYVDNGSLLALPNAFTPGSGANNALKLIKRGEATLNYYRIFNRWGNKVFETTNIDEGWDGTYNGKPQPYDVFVYQIEATTNTGKVFYKSGNVTLIR